MLYALAITEQKKCCELLAHKWPVSSFAKQLQTTRNNMQQGVQTDATGNIQQCRVRLHEALFLLQNLRMDVILPGKRAKQI